MVPRRDLHWPSLAILTTGLLSVCPLGVLAQTSTAVCLSTFNWMNNSKNQNPCLVTAYLQGACNGGRTFTFLLCHALIQSSDIQPEYTVNPLPANEHYTGPYADQNNPCQCSSVTYNTISACGACQNRTIVSWSVWDPNCTTIYPGVYVLTYWWSYLRVYDSNSFPLGIPGGTAVPAWAFQDVTTSDLFNITLAESVGDNPESTATNAQSTGSLVPTSTFASASLTNSPSSTSGSTSSGSSSNTGAIAGGVVGGVVGIALIVGAAVFFIVKKRFRILPLARFTSIPMTSTYPSPGDADTTPFTPQMAPPKLYDPSDPTTFPTSPLPTTITSGSSNNIQDPSVGYYSPTTHRGYYSGVPEI
ncbi:hypothetical protein J3R83DRAFT_205 [Lanmaoa asiatica]|nr:hypothetical protein J3R83DRAFT_205 [Lanmaoa asiatica]